MSPAELSRLAVLGTVAFGGFLCCCGAWLIGLTFVGSAAFIAYHVNYNS